ncbi:hypothetical protein PAMP_020148 [Pampus punctatissimus]
MADKPHRHHGNFPQRRATLLPRKAKCRLQLALEAMSSETGPNPASTTEEPNLPAEHLSSTGFCEMEKEPNWPCNGKTTAAEKQQHPHRSVAALLKRIRIHPEAQRILGNSCIAVVSLERLNFQSVSLSSLQPVVSLVRLPSHVQLHSDVSCLVRPQQNGFSHNEADILEIEEGTPESSDLIQPETTTETSWTEPYCPDSCPYAEPEQDSGFDCDSNPDQPYILCDSGSDEWYPDGKTDSETFYLDPDPEPTIMIELDSEPESEQDQDQSLQLEDEFESKWEADVVQMNDSENQRELSCSPSQEVAKSSIQTPETGAASEEMESEDFCAVCLNGGDLLCCDRCPKVFHLACHIPSLISFPLGDWVCTLCRTDHEPVEAYDCENTHSCGGVKAPYTLSNQDQRARNYYQIIKRPIDLSVIRRKLDKSNTLHYFTAEQFVDDLMLMFKNCATFNYPDSEVGQAGRNLEVFFLSKLKELFPERTFPSASQDRMDRARLQWLNRKRKENYKKKRCVFSGKKYYL